MSLDASLVNDGYRLHLEDDSTDHFVEELELPLVGLNAVRGHMVDALDHVTVTRKGAVVMGPKSIGKSVALQQVVTRFHRGEALKEAKNAGYARRSVMVLPTVAAEYFIANADRWCVWALRMM